MKKFNVFAIVFLDMFNVFENIKKKLHHTNFGKSIVVLVGGTALGQVVQLIAAPFITRLYRPEDFGLLAVYMAILGIVSVVASLRYELAIPLPSDDDMASCLLVGSLFCVLAVSLITGIFIFLFGDHLIVFINAPRMQPFLWLLPIGVFGAGSYKVLNYWAVRKKAFGKIATTKLSQGLGTALLQIILGFMKIGSGGLLFGHFVGQCVGISTLLSHVVQFDKHNVLAVRWRGVRKAAVCYRHFPLYSSPSAVLNTLSVQTPVLILSYFGGASVVGFFIFSLQVLQAPISLIGQAVSQVFTSTAAQADRDGDIASLTLRIFNRLVQVGLPLMFLVGLSAPEIFSLVFGSEWRESGLYAQILSPWLFLVFVSSPLSILPSVKGKQKQEMLFNGSLLFCRIAVLLICGFFHRISLAIVLYGFVSALFWFIFMLWNMNLSGNTWTSVVGVLFRESLSVIPFVVLLVVAKLFFPVHGHDLSMLIITILCGVLISIRIYRLNFSE